MSRIAWLALLASGAAGCASLSTDVQVQQRELPDAFAGAPTGPSPAGTPWRQWFPSGELTGLIDEALKNNQDLQIALQRIQITRAAARGATGALLPQVALALGSGMEKVGRYTSDGAGNATTEITPGRLVPVPEASFLAGLQASWELDLWGRLRSQREAAIAQYLASVEGTNLVITSLIADVASAYFDLLALDHVREVLGQAVARQQEAVEVVRLQKQAGRANELAVQQFEAQLAETRALEREASLGSVETENRLNVLLGRYPTRVPRNKQILFKESPLELSAGLPAELLANRPDIREAELQVRAAKFDVKAARAAFFPTLSLTASAGLEAFNPRYLFRVPESLTYSVGGGLLAPLVNRRAIEAQFVGAKAHQIQAMLNYQRAVLTAYVEVVNALSGVRHAEEILALKKAQKTAMLQSVETADMLYRAGKASYLEVLVAQQGALRADVDLVEAWKRRHVSSVLVYKTLGGGWR